MTYTIQWMLNTQSGPAIGEQECSTPEEVWSALEENIRSAFPQWNDNHQAALLQIKQSFDNRSGGRWRYRSTAVSLTLSSE